MLRRFKCTKKRVPLASRAPPLPCYPPPTPPSLQNVTKWCRSESLHMAKPTHTTRAGQENRGEGGTHPASANAREAVDLWPRLAPRTPARPGNLRGPCSVSPLTTCRPIHIPTLIYGRRICEPQTGLRRLICVSETLAAQSSP